MLDERQENGLQKQRAHAFHSLKFILAWITFVMLGTSVHAEYCGGQPWHSGWLDETQVTYQAYSHTNGFTVFGGKTDAAKKLRPRSSQPLYDATVSTAAVLLTLTDADKEPTNVALLNSFFHVTQVSILGVKAVGATSGSNVIAVLETTQTDNDLYYFVQIVFNSGTAQAGILVMDDAANLSNWQIATFTSQHNRIWILADWNQGIGGLDIYRLQANTSTGALTLSGNGLYSHDTTQDQLLKAVLLNKNYLFRVSKGTCGSSSKSIIVSISDSSSDNADITNVQKISCINPDDVGTGFDLKPVGMGVLAEAGDVAVVLEEISSNYEVVVAYFKYELFPTVKKLRTLGFNDNSSLQVMSVSHEEDKKVASSITDYQGAYCPCNPNHGLKASKTQCDSECTCNCWWGQCYINPSWKYFYYATRSNFDTVCTTTSHLKLHLLVQKQSGSGVQLWITQGYNPADGTISGSYLVSLTAAVPTVASKLTQSASYLGYFFDPMTVFMIHGKDFTIKLSKNTGTTQTDQCVTSPLVSTAVGLIEKIQLQDFSATDGITEFTQISYSPSTTELSPGKAEYLASPYEGLLQQNVCGYDLGDLFTGVTKNLLKQQTESLDNTGLTNPSCTSGTPIASGIGDYKYQIQDISLAATGQIWTDVSDFFDFASGNVVEVKARADDAVPFESGAYTLTYRFGHSSLADQDISALQPKTTTITLVEGCSFIMPTSQDVTTNSNYKDGFTFLKGTSPALRVTFGNFSSDCLQTTQILNNDGTSFNPLLFQKVDLKTFEFQFDDPAYEKTYDLIFRAQSQMKADEHHGEYPFTVTFLMSRCTKKWQFPTHSGTFDTTYTIDEDKKKIVNFTNVALTDCPFKLALMNITDGVPQPVDVPYLTLVQPVFETDSLDNQIVIVRSYGQLIIETSDNRVASQSILQLRVIADRYENESDYQSFNFRLQIGACVNVDKDRTVKTHAGIKYTIGDPTLVLSSVKQQNLDCLNSYFVVDPDPLPQGFKLLNDTNTNTISISVHGQDVEELAVGIYSITVAEIDNHTGFTAKTDFIISVEASEVKNRTEQQKPDIANNVTDAVDSEAEQKSNQNDSQTQNQEGSNEHQIEVQVDGSIVYPWQQVVHKKRKEQKFVIEETQIVQLKALVTSVSLTGNLTITFNKPIVVPPIKVYPVTHARRLLQRMLEIEEVLAIYIESDFYESDSEAIQVEGYQLTRMNEMAMDVQVNFTQPSKISQSAVEPDGLVVKFIKPSIFMDSLDATQLKSESSVEYPIQPQISTEELEKLKQTAEKVADSVATFSWGLVALQVVLAFGLKHLWNIMNLLQFLCFMISWSIRLPHTTRIILNQLKSLAFLEFIPTEWFKGAVRDFLGIEEEFEDPCEGEQGICEQSGSARFGSTDLIENMGALLFVAFALLIVLAILIPLFILSKKSERGKKVYIAIKKKLFYNSFLRYVLQSSLKLQMAACTIIFFEKFAVDELQEEVSTSQKVGSFLILTILSMCPFLFLAIMIMNKENLHKKEIREKIGTLYNGLRPVSSVAGHSFVFLIRRSVFVAISFLIFEDPNIQVQLFILLTLLYITYVNYSTFYESSKAKALETINEFTFCLIMYNFVLLNNLVQPEVGLWCGNAITGFTGLLLLLNMTVIVVVSIQAIIRKCYLRRLRIKAVIEMEARALQSNKKLEQKKEQKVEDQEQQQLQKQQLKNDIDKLLIESFKSSSLFKSQPSSSEQSKSSSSSLFISESSISEHAREDFIKNQAAEILKLQRQKMKQKYGIEPIGSDMFNDSGSLKYPIKLQNGKSYNQRDADTEEDIQRSSLQLRSKMQIQSNLMQELPNAGYKINTRSGYKGDFRHYYPDFVPDQDIDQFGQPVTSFTLQSTSNIQRTQSYDPFAVTKNSTTMPPRLVSNKSVEAQIDPKRNIELIKSPSQAVLEEDLKLY